MVFAIFGSPFVVLLAILAALLPTQMIHLVTVIKWCDARTTGVNYYGRSRDERCKFKTVLRIHRAVLTPVSYTHLRAHETNDLISYSVFCL